MFKASNKWGHYHECKCNKKHQGCFPIIYLQYQCATLKYHLMFQNRGPHMKDLLELEEGIKNNSPAVWKFGGDKWGPDVTMELNPKHGIIYVGNGTFQFKIWYKPIKKELLKWIDDLKWYIDNSQDIYRIKAGDKIWESSSNGSYYECC